VLGTHTPSQVSQSRFCVFGSDDAEKWKLITTTDQAAGLTAQERDLAAAGAGRIFGAQISSTAKRGSSLNVSPSIRG
jgi:hypothetical protein